MHVNLIFCAFLVVNIKLVKSFAKLRMRNVIDAGN